MNGSNSSNTSLQGKDRKQIGWRFELFKKEINKTMKKIMIYPAPKWFKLTNAQDIAVKLSTEPILIVGLIRITLLLGYFGDMVPGISVIPCHFLEVQKY